MRLLPWVVIAAGCSTWMVQPMRDVDIGRAADLAVQPEVVILDVRAPEEYAAGHIKGAVSLPLPELLSGKTFLLPTDKDKMILVYCEVGRRSAQAGAVLAQRGYTQVNNLSGGLSAWKKAGQLVVK